MNDTHTQNRPAPLVLFKQDLQRLKDAGELDMLPTNVSFEAFRNAAVVAITDNPSILQCGKESVFKAIRRLAAAGLVPDGREAAIVPFKGQAQAMPMVYGLLKVARNSGEVASIYAEVVRGDETFTIRMVNGERSFDHSYDPLNRTGEVRGAYAVAKLKDGTVEVEAMGKGDIEKRRRASANQRSEEPTGIWKDWYDEMAKKTVIRALVKRLPMSSEDMRRIMVEQDDLLPSRDVTPTEAKVPLSQRLREEAPHPVQDAPRDITPHWSTQVDTLDAFPGDGAWDEGVDAAQNGIAREACPYEGDIDKAVHWLGGYDKAREAAA